MSEDDSWMEPESIWDMRRKAPFHFLAKADNARMSAYVLSHVAENSAADFASEAGYNGTANIALYEAFKREASIALELILKAILCVKNKVAPPATHDVYKLWSQACLPALSDDDYYRLVRMTQILYWSGRYAAPKSDKLMEKSNDLLRKYKKASSSGKLKIVEHTSLGWEEFEAIYQIAHGFFWELKPNDPNNFVA